MADDLQNKRLYKFYSYNERNLEALASPYLWFSRLQDFNDPFEGKMRHEAKVPSTSEGIAYLKRLFQNNGLAPIEAESLIRRNLIGRSDEETIAYIKDTIKIGHERAKHALFEDNGFCSLIATSNDIDSNLTPEQDILMWSHYANGLRGFRVEFDSEILLESLEESPDVTPIKYSKTPPTFDLYAFGNAYFDDRAVASQILLNCLTYKHSAWKYESEIRLGNSRPGKFTYDSRAIKEIVVGEKIAPDQLRVLSRVINSHPNQIPTKKAWISRESYDLVIR